MGIKSQNHERQELYAPLVRHEDVVDPPELDVDLEAEVGKGLRGGFHHVLDLDTLRGHSQEGVPNTLHLGCGQRKQMSTRQSAMCRCQQHPWKQGEKPQQEEHRGKGPLLSPLAPAPHAPYTGVFPGRMTMMS